MDKPKGGRSIAKRWTEQESKKLASLVAAYKGTNGPKLPWTQIAQAIPGKTASQCSQRWNRVTKPNIRKGRWSKGKGFSHPKYSDEEDQLMKAVKKFGTRWNLIAKKLKRRSDIQCRYQYCKLTHTSNY